MKFNKFLFLIFVLAAFVFHAQAQRCGGYKTTLQIQDGEGKKVEGVLIQILPLDNDETRGKQFVQSKVNPKEFTILFGEFQVLRGKYKLFVFSPENETFEMITQFPHCKDQKFNVVLSPDGKGSVHLKGKVADSSGAVMPYISIHFENREGKTFRASTNDAGEYGIILRSGKYKVKAEYGSLICVMENKEKKTRTDTENRKI